MAKTSIGKILIVDDEVELKNILVEALATQGYQTSGFTSGEEALVALRKETFDVLFTDLMMPDMDGIALVNEALQIDPHLVAIVMTGQGTIQTAVDAMKVGAFDYVLKPFRLQTVLPVLTRAMNTRHMRLENLQLRETVAIYELSQTIAFTLDRQTIVSKLADAALQQTDADEVSILFPTEDGQELYVAAVRGENRQRLLGERIPLRESISSWVVHERMPLILDGEVNDNRFRALWPRPEICSAISIPMQVANKLVGTININALNRARPFTLGQMKALTILASTAAAALESASLYAQVQQAEKNYRAIFENAVEGIFQSTSEGRFITVNPAMARIFGYDSPEEVVKGVTNIANQIYVHPEDRERSNAVGHEVGFIRGFEFEAYRKDGERIWLSLNRRSVYDDNGKELFWEGSVEDITERKQAEKALRSSEAEMRALFAAITDVIIVFDADGRYLKIAPTNSADPHKPPDQLVGKTQHELFPKDTADFLVSHIRRALNEGRPHRLEYRLNLEGTDVWFDGSVAPLSKDSVIWIARDISERKRAEEERARLAAEIENQRQRLDNIVGSVPGVVWEAWGTPGDPNLRFDFISDYVETMLGYTVDEFLSTPNFWLNVVHPDDRERTLTEAFAGFASHEPTTIAFRWVRKDGSVVWVESTSTVVTNEAGEPVGVRGVTVDISERKRAEEALRQSEERYRDLVENAHDIIYSHDLRGNYTSINKAGEVVTGYTVKEALKLNLADTTAPEYLPKAREMMQRKLAGERVTAYEIEVIAKDGHRVTVEVNTKLVYENGVPVGVQGIARDITERKQLEEQLRQSQKMEAIGQLAGGVAHDFNNLLTAINGYSSLALQRIEENSSIKPYLEEVRKAGDRAANLTRQLLAFGRKQILQPVPLDLNNIVTDMNKMLRRLIGEDIELTAKLSLELKKIKADPGQIEQVIVNLVVNARDAMPQGGKLTIETANATLGDAYTALHVGAQAGNYVMLAVSDTGTGMDEATRARIFEPFFTTKEKGKGTGLGLSTVYGIVQQSGGSIWVYSELNRGTTFKVYLPQLASELDLAEEKDSTAEQIVPGSETILLVEDEDVVRGLATNILETAGYKVLSSAGPDAVEICERAKDSIHLLLTDVVMPQTSGKEIAEKLQKLRPRLKVLYMSGYTDEAIVHHGVLDENVEFIQKPFTPSALSRKVREVLDSNGRTRQN